MRANKGKNVKSARIQPGGWLAASIIRARAAVPGDADRTGSLVANLVLQGQAPLALAIGALPSGSCGPLRARVNARATTA